MARTARCSAPLPTPARAREGLTRRDLLAAAGLVAAPAVLAACSGGGATASDAVRGAGGGSAVAAVTVTDQRGRRITLDHPAARLVTIPMPAAAILVAVDGGAEHIVGMQGASWQALADGILGEFFPAARGLAHDVAGNTFAPNVESVLALRPDVVIQWADQGAGLLAPLENAGLTVVGLTYGTQQDLTTWVSLFADLLGRPERGRAINDLIATALRDMAQLGRQARSHPTVVYLNRFTGGLKVAAAGTYNDVYIKLVGATNPAGGPRGAPGQGMVGVDVEQVLAWDPEILLLGTFDDAVPADLYGSAVWRGARAVRERRVYKVPLGGYRWDPPSHESPLMWRWLSMVAGTGPGGYDLRGRVVEDYRLFYGHVPDDAQLDAILQTSVNDGSAGYGQFHAA